MIKGVLLSVSLAVFITSLAFTVAGLTGHINENLITGAAIGAEQARNYAVLSTIISGLTSFFIILKMR